METEENEMCSKCAGSGEGMYAESTCTTCGGSGTALNIDCDYCNRPLVETFRGLPIHRDCYDAAKAEYDNPERF